MSVHSTYYADEEEYERDLKWEYRKEQWEQDHGIIDDLPFYTDDPNDPHWRCENCAHCREFHALKPIIHFSDYVDEKGYVHNNPEKPVRQNLCAMWSNDKYVMANLCEVSNHQVLDDDYCEEFIEVKP